MSHFVRRLYYTYIICLPSLRRIVSLLATGEGFEEVRPIVPYASDDEIIQAAQEAIHEELRRRGLE